jgi:hypothetical protein
MNTNTKTTTKSTTDKPAMTPANASAAAAAAAARMLMPPPAPMLHKKKLRTMALPTPLSMKPDTLTTSPPITVPFFDVKTVKSPKLATDMPAGTESGQTTPVPVQAASHSTINFRPFPIEALLSNGATELDANGNRVPVVFKNRKNIGPLQTPEDRVREVQDQKELDAANQKIARLSLKVAPRVSVQASETMHPDLLIRVFTLASPVEEKAVFHFARESLVIAFPDMYPDLEALMDIATRCSAPQATIVRQTIILFCIGFVPAFMKRILPHCITAYHAKEFATFVKEQWHSFVKGCDLLEGRQKNRIPQLTVVPELVRYCTRVYTKGMAFAPIKPPFVPLATVVEMAGAGAAPGASPSGAA